MLAGFLLVTQDVEQNVTQSCYQNCVRILFFFSLTYFYEVGLVGGVGEMLISFEKNCHSGRWQLFCNGREEALLGEVLGADSRSVCTWELYRFSCV